MAIHFKKLAIALGMLLVSSSALARGHHSHGASMNEAEQKTSGGVFDDNRVRNRALTGWDGMWQSVYPYLASGELDPVFKRRAEKDEGKTAEQIKTYHRTGYATNIDTTGIESGVVEFHAGNQVASCKYDYTGYKILSYKSGKKGVRYLFECKAADSKAPEHVQFSDHIIAPRKSSHSHISMGNTSQTVLSEEMENWSTYCPCQLKGREIVDEILHR